MIGKDWKEFPCQVKGKELRDLKPREDILIQPLNNSVWSLEVFGWSSRRDNVYSSHWFGTSRTLSGNPMNLYWKSTTDAVRVGTVPTRWSGLRQLYVMRLFVSERGYSKLWGFHSITLHLADPQCVRSREQNDDERCIPGWKSAVLVYTAEAKLPSTTWQHRIRYLAAQVWQVHLLYEKCLLKKIQDFDVNPIDDSHGNTQTTTHHRKKQMIEIHELHFCVLSTLEQSRKSILEEQSYPTSKRNILLHEVRLDTFAKTSHIVTCWWKDVWTVEDWKIRLNP